MKESMHAWRTGLVILISHLSAAYWNDSQNAILIIVGPRDCVQNEMTVPFEWRKSAAIKNKKPEASRLPVDEVGN
jgi:hypothetical protein